MSALDRVQAALDALEQKISDEQGEVSALITALRPPLPAIYVVVAHGPVQITTQRPYIFYPR